MFNESTFFEKCAIAFSGILFLLLISSLSAVGTASPSRTPANSDDLSVLKERADHLESEVAEMKAENAAKDQELSVIKSWACNQKPAPAFCK